MWTCFMYGGLFNFWYPEKVEEKKAAQEAMDEK
jgi:hypothetical protein